jgi:Ca2+-binding EF-hand superfamily protein
LDYVKQLTTLVLTRMEDKYRNITDIFRFMDERGKGKVRKSDFTQAVERMRISIAREDVQKVWNYIDAKQ